MAKSPTASKARAPLRELGRFTQVRRSVIGHMIDQGAKARFVSTEMSKELRLAPASCNKVVNTLAECGWLELAEQRGTVKEYRFASGGIGMARAYAEAHDEARGL